MGGRRRRRCRPSGRARRRGGPVEVSPAASPMSTSSCAVSTMKPGICRSWRWSWLLSQAYPPGRRPEHRSTDEAERGFVVGDSAGVAGGVAGLAAFAEAAEQVPVEEVAAEPVAAVVLHVADESRPGIVVKASAGPAAGAEEGVPDRRRADPMPVRPQVGRGLRLGHTRRVKAQVDEDLGEPARPGVRRGAGRPDDGFSEDGDQRPGRRPVR